MVAHVHACLTAFLQPGSLEVVQPPPPLPVHARPGSWRRAVAGGFADLAQHSPAGAVPEMVHKSFIHTWRLCSSQSPKVGRFFAVMIQVKKSTPFSWHVQHLSSWVLVSLNFFQQQQQQQQCRADSATRSHTTSVDPVSCTY